MVSHAAWLEEALETLGELLETRAQRFEIVVIGGGSLLLMGVIQRPTKDLDVVALVVSGAIARAEPWPEPLREAVADVAVALKLDEQWLNPGPTSLVDCGLPSGFSERLTARPFRNLVVHFASRLDQVFFKFYAMVDQGPRSKHAQDLKKLAPSSAELLEAARWSRQQDSSEGFRSECVQALRFFGVEVTDV